MITSDKVTIPEVLHDLIQYDYQNGLVLAQFCAINSDLEGKPGESVTVPYTASLSDAEDVEEGGSLTPEANADSEVTVTIKKAGKAVQMTEEALNRAAYDVADDRRIKIAKSIARKVDADVDAAMALTTLVHDISAIGSGKISYDAIVDAQSLMGEEFYDNKPVLVIHSSQMTDLRKTPDFKAGFVQTPGMELRNFAGMLLDVPVVISDRVKKDVNGVYEAKLVAPGSIVLAYKKRPKLYYDLNILNETHYLSSFIHYGVKLINPNRGIVKLLTK